MPIHFWPGVGCGKMPTYWLVSGKMPPIFEFKHVELHFTLVHCLSAARLFVSLLKLLAQVSSLLKLLAQVPFSSQALGSRLLRRLAEVLYDVHG